MSSIMLLIAVCITPIIAMCPSNWTASPRGDKCYKLTAKPTTHRGCANLCGSGASLACIRSRAENDFLRDHVVLMDEWWRGAWIGLYQWPYDQGSSVGWDWCANGQAANYTNFVQIADDAFGGDVFNTGDSGRRLAGATVPGLSRQNRRLTHMSTISGDYSNRYEDCAGFNPSSMMTTAFRSDTGAASPLGSMALAGEWFDAPCETVRRCLCERPWSSDAASQYNGWSSIYLSHADELHTSRWSLEAWQQRYAQVFLLAVLPACYMAITWALRRCCYRTKQDAEGHSTEERRGEGAENKKMKLTLMRAESMRAAFRARVSFVLLQLGWFLLVFCFAFVAGTYGFEHINLPGFKGVAVGTWVSCLLPISIELMLLALLPTDKRAIDFVCGVTFIWCLFISFTAVPFTFIVYGMMTNPMALVRTMASLDPALAVPSGSDSASGEGIDLSPTEADVFGWQGLLVSFLAHGVAHVFGLIRLSRAVLVCGCCGQGCDQACCYAPLSPRAKLRRLWATVRMLCLVYGLLAVYNCATSPARSAAQGTTVVAPMQPDAYEDDSIASFVALALVSVFCALWPSPARRGRITRFLGSLGQRGGSGNNEQYQAAAVAALLGGRGVESALEMAGSKFRVLPLDKLSEDDMATSKDTGLFGKTVAASLGEADAFVSHSWVCQLPPSIPLPFYPSCDA